jgi:RimJ/RimL family protein N-acetyltransferase
MRMNKNELKIKRYAGEKSAIRFFDSENREDMLRLRKIVDHPEVQEMMDSVAGMSKMDRLEWADEKGVYGRYYMFAVSGTKENFPDNPSEVGQVQGFVYLYAGAEEKMIASRMIRAGFIKKEEVDDYKIFEISFAKLPKAQGGQISSAVRQACLELKRLDRMKKGTGVFVFCFIDETNAGSMRVAEACGFERRGKHFYEADSREMSALFVLSYKKLAEIEKKRRNG